MGNSVSPEALAVCTIPTYVMSWEIIASKRMRMDPLSPPMLWADRIELARVFFLPPGVRSRVSTGLPPEIITGVSMYLIILCLHGNLNRLSGANAGGAYCA